MLNDRYRRFGADPLDQALAAARHQHIDVLIQLQHRTDRRAIRRRDELHAGRGQAGVVEAAGDRRGDGRVRVNGF